MGTTVFGFTCIVNYLNMPLLKTVPFRSMEISTMFRFALNLRKQSTTNQKRGFLNLLQLELIIPPVNFMLRVTEPKGNTLSSIEKCRNALPKNSGRLSKKKQHSQNYNKQKARIQKLHTKVANQRQDFLHKKALELVTTYDLLCFEDLNLKNHQSESEDSANQPWIMVLGCFLSLWSTKLKIEANIPLRLEKLMLPPNSVIVVGTKTRRSPFPPESGNVHSVIPYITETRMQQSISDKKGCVCFIQCNHVNQYVG